jgi:hypothetical protein
MAQRNTADDSSDHSATSNANSPIDPLSPFNPTYLICAMTATQYKPNTEKKAVHGGYITSNTREVMKAEFRNLRY